LTEIAANLPERAADATRRAHYARNTPQTFAETLLLAATNAYTLHIRVINV
jgi:hypothetical protein